MEIFTYDTSVSREPFKVRKLDDRTQFTLDELLSEKALKLLNEQGFVCFVTKDPDVKGWFFRNQIRSIHKEGVCVSVPVAGK